LKNPAKHWLDAQHGEQGSSGHQPGHALGPVSSGEAEAFFPVRRQAFEDLVSISPIQEVGSGDGFLAVPLKVALKDDDDPIRIREGKRTKQDCVDHTEDHAVRPDAQSKHEDSHGGKSAVACHHSNRVSNVLKKCLHNVTHSDFLFSIFYFLFGIDHLAPQLA
jgi:hypothetical protein